MKKIIVLSFILSFYVLSAQQPYYNDVDLTLTGTNLKNALATKITNTHTNTLDYTDAREALKIVDLNPSQGTNVLLLYGFSDGLCPSSSSSDNDHRRRNKSSFGGDSSCEWNREHTYPKSLGTPNLGTSGPGADAHHLRAADVQRNSQRGSLRFAAGSGNSGTVSGGWYPGDEWKGDVARMMMYMYLRYGSQCLPKNVCAGSTVSGDSNMVNLLLQWNADDPVSTYEDKRNTYLEDASNSYGQGNRNPFIDNPRLATIIWGGPEAENRWDGLSYQDVLKKHITVFPNPTSNIVTIQSDISISKIDIYNTFGQLVFSSDYSKNIDISKLNPNIYVLKITDSNKRVFIQTIIKH